ncbi:Zn(II)2Cys6 transcription factor acuM [Tothia fuscella]|uniref:Zn(II)2Cys6 transcription factor acuM n=1 Tax=Tothia fuscella TaxID=1048955 RepID=A0A9P4NVH9_9PEZI|nr:Zn(II)2Cys6 transcription factor acuM [Tothia fuscella]
MKDTQAKSNGAVSRSMTATSSGPGSAEKGLDTYNNSSNRGEKHAPRTPSKTASAGGVESTSGGKMSAKKRRKVNHACIYCRRSHMTCDLERPCTRCIKRNIGHLCHDEPREPAKKTKSEPGGTAGENDPASAVSQIDPSTVDSPITPLESNRQDAGLNPAQLPQSRVASTTAIVQPTPVAAPHQQAMTGNNQPPVLGFQDWNFNNNQGTGRGQNLMQDMHSFHPPYLFNTSEVSNEYNLLNDFLSNSLLEDGGMYSNDDVNGLFSSDPSLSNTMQTLSANPALFMPNQQANQNQMLPPSQAALGNAISRPASGFPIDKARETYYMTAADPAGTEAPEERLKKLLKAKYDAGMLKPFNYVKGYARLQQYMERNLHQNSRNRIIRQLNAFRPQFRERMQGLTDMQLVLTEMGFEKNLMEYDRVFASMAIPACCWRRTGEIFRGNKEMAELIHVPIDHLRDGRIAIHEIFAEQSLVGYWEKFGAIAFDTNQKAILTSCVLKNRNPASGDPDMKCCFSFTIRRDDHRVPSLIVGNFLQILPLEP